MKKKHINIPVFIPELACPNRCVFCNQQKISGQMTVPDIPEVDRIIRTYLSTATDNTVVNIAFFGGNFTGIPLPEQKVYLDLAAGYIRQKRVHGIRLSTRPDYITPETVGLLRDYPISEVELGVQSTDDEVLKASGRGHTKEDVYRAVELLKTAGIPYGLQMMLGLPGDTHEKALHTAREIVALGAVSTRIYPCLVIPDTALATLYGQGKYHPLTLDEAISWGEEVLRYFISQDVRVLRVGLHASDDLRSGTNILAGPFHPAMKEMMLSAIWADELAEVSVENKARRILIEVPSGQVNYAAGFKGINKRKLLESYREVKLVENDSLKKLQYRVSEL
ncbi:elongator complex protein 3 [Parabacteroides sp. FAFU027]|uniref:elongator complex protein 3 n=1 Tax=Parabacteroides sp. FAFU027 TaxID=2922715 RepID=UPI001FAF50ED|nr:radical SAM protein [Parabacteroides sp. FAFU027]